MSSSADDELRLLAALPHDGSTRSRMRLSHDLDWDAGHLSEVVRRLEQGGIVVRAPGRGGTLRRASGRIDALALAALRHGLAARDAGVHAIGSLIDADDDTPRSGFSLEGASGASPGGASPGLEDNVMRWFERALGQRSEKYLDALLRRFGIDEKPRLTLEECGHLVGVTRERIRQIEKAMKGRLSEVDPPAQVLEDFLDNVAAVSPTTVDACLEHLREGGVIAGELDLEPVFELCGVAGLRDVPVVVDDMVGLSEAALTLLSDNRRRILSEWRTLEVRHIAQIENAWSAGDDDAVGLPVDASSYVATLCTSGELVQLMDGWYTRLPSGDSRSPYTSFVPKTVVRTLSVCGPLRLDCLWRGVVRRAKRQNLAIPTLPVFAELLKHMPGVTISKDVASLDDTVRRSDLGDADQAIIDCIRGATRGWATYDALKAAVTRIGLNEANAAQAASFSPLIMRIGRDRWVIRASEPTEFEGRYDDEFKQRQAEGELIATRLRRTRQKRNLSQQGVADLLRVNQAMISNWERGKLPIPPKHLPHLLELFPELDDPDVADD